MNNIPNKGMKFPREDFQHTTQVFSSFSEPPLLKTSKAWIYLVFWSKSVVTDQSDYELIYARCNSEEEEFSTQCPRDSLQKVKNK